MSDTPVDPAAFAGRTVLVTGAGGFIGSHLVERLVGLGARVRAFVRYTSHGGAGWLDRSPARGDIEVVRGDLADRDSVEASAEGCDVALHLGALIAIPYSYQAPESYVRTNVIGTLNVLQAARRHGLSRVVHVSTSEVYGTAQIVPMTEAHPLVGQSPYSATKIGADKLAESYCLSFGTPVVTLRPFNTFGPRQSARAVIPTLITQALAGQTVRLGDLRPTRDFVFVDDTVEGFVRAALTPGIEGETIHLGTGVETSVSELIDRVRAVTGADFEVISEAERLRPEASEVMRLIADAGHARARLGWAPTVTLDHGLARTTDFIRAHADLYRPREYAV
ncbi:MAG: SDR family NAD(P)-dependent oxidoreductase [Brevundimonas sp.]|jgi:NAD dependent epimerase/dehydratase|uniref:SDR family NAD(P)-dependent oxidoreductase n=1 Tax=Brevundimonas sp. TaxID=1871086 RepID=UPI00391A1919